MTASFSTMGSRRVPSLFAATIIFLVPFISGFVNVPVLRKPALTLSTFTSVTHGQGHVALADTYQRDPLAQDVLGEDVRDRDATADGIQQNLSERSPGFWLSQVAGSLVRRLPPNLSSLVIQVELTRRKLKKKRGVQLHNALRDSGLLRGIMDFAVTIGTPALALERPEIIPQFLQLTQNTIYIPYGTHQRQVIEMYLPLGGNEPRGLVFFVVCAVFGTLVRTMIRHYLTGLYLVFSFLSMEELGAVDCRGSIEWWHSHF
jgi:hypothetical protein